MMFLDGHGPGSGVRGPGSRRVLGVFAALLMATACAAADPVRDGVLRIELPGAAPYNVRRDRTWTAQPRLITIDLTRRNGAWEPGAWAWIREIPGQEHRGSATVSGSGDALTITLRFAINHNRDRPCALGGSADYVVSLKPSPPSDGPGFIGTFTGNTVGADDPALLTRLSEEWGGVKGGKVVKPVKMDEALTDKLLSGPVSGNAQARLVVTAAPAKVNPIAPGEHPRLFFRTSDLPRLRALAGTDFGKRLIAKVREELERDQIGFTFHPPGAPAMGEGFWAAGHAFLYQLTGDRIEAERAQEVCMAIYNGAWKGGWGGLADRLFGFAVAYDLCYEAFDPGFRDVMTIYLERQARQCAMLERGINPLNMGEEQVFEIDMVVGTPRGADDAWVARYRAAAGMAALAILGDPVPGLREPGRIADARVIPPCTGYDPPIGVPVVPFVHNEMQCRWLMNGLFLTDIADPLASVGGFAHARPVPGQVIRYHGFDLPFRQFYVPRQFYGRNQHPFWTYHHRFGGFQTGARMIQSLNAQRRRGRLAMYHVLDNDQERVVQVRNNMGYASFNVMSWINGVPCRDGDLVRLAPGLYPVMVDFWITGGYVHQAPRLYEYGERDYRRDRSIYDVGAKAYLAAGKTMPGMDQHLAVFARSLRRYVDVTMGQSGWSEAPGGAETFKLVIPFMAAYRNATGIDLTTGTGIPRLATLACATHGEGSQNGNLSHLTLPVALPFLPEDQKPLARWFLERHGWGTWNPFHLITVFSAFPDVPAKPPGEVLAKTLVDQGLGAFFTVSGWDPARDALTSVQLGLGPRRYVAPGNIIMRAFNSVWTPSRGNAITVEKAHPTAPARVLHSAFSADGSGVVTMVVDRFRGRQNGKDLPITWTRSIGIDHSGTSGAPCLIAVADRVVGASERVLSLSFTLGDTDSDVHEHGFTVLGAPIPGKAKMRSSLHATIAAPPKANCWTESWAGKAVAGRPAVGAFTSKEVTARVSLEDPDQWQQELAEEQFDTYVAALDQTQDKDDLGVAELDDPDDDEAVHIQREQRAQAIKANQGRLKETGTEKQQVERIRRAMEWNKDPDRTGCFFMIYTMQEGEPPKVVVTGEGLAATATVGGQTVRFDGEKIVFGKP